jgi:hypothetical protein
MDNNAGTHKAFMVALLLRAILAGLIYVESLQGTEPQRPVLHLKTSAGQIVEIALQVPNWRFARHPRRLP